MTDRDICPACGYEHTKGGHQTKPDVWLCRNGKCSAMLVTDPRCTPRLHRLATEELVDAGLITLDRDGAAVTAIGCKALRETWPLMPCNWHPE